MLTDKDKDKNILKKPKVKQPPVPKVIYDKKHDIKYDLGASLGEGGFARCYVIEDQSSKSKFCCKAMWKAKCVSAKDKTRVNAEVAIQRKLKHDKIVKFHSACEDDQFIYIIMELCERRTLKELIKRRKYLSEVEVRFYILQLLEVIEFLMQKRVIHRDIKLANIFLAENLNIKVGDFGLAGVLNEDETRRLTMCGTPNYIAPEVLFDKKGHSYEVDMWALGVTMYTLLVGEPPFQAKGDLQQIYDKIKERKLTYPEDLKLSQNAKDAIDKILQLDPAERPNFQQVRALPFFQDYCPPFLPIEAYNKLPQLVTTVKADIKNKVETELTAAEIVSAVDNDGFVRPSLPYSPPDKANNEKTQTATSDPVKASPSKASTGEPQMSQLSSSIASRYPLFYNIATSYHRIRDLILQGSSVRKIDKEIGSPCLDCPNYVAKWIDHGVVYGFGYTLADKSSGILCNDHTIIASSWDGKHFEHISREKSHYYSSAPFTNTDIPREYQKKMKLLQKFQHQMSGRTEGQFSTEALKKYFPAKVHSPEPFVPAADSMENGYRVPQLPFVSKFFTCQKYVFFKVNEDFVQMSNTATHEKFIIAQGGRALFVIFGNCSVTSYSISYLLHEEHQAKSNGIKLDAAKLRIIRSLNFFLSAISRATIRVANQTTQQPSVAPQLKT